MKTTNDDQATPKHEYDEEDLKRDWDAAGSPSEKMRVMSVFFEVTCDEDSDTQAEMEMASSMSHMMNAAATEYEAEDGDVSASAAAIWSMAQAMINAADEED